MTTCNETTVSPRRSAGHFLTIEEATAVDQIIKASPHASDRQLAEQTGLSASAIRYRRKRLVEAGGKTPAEIASERAAQRSQHDAAIARAIVRGARIDLLYREIPGSSRTVAARAQIVRQRLLRAGAVALGFLEDGAP